jgi:hypothetical protein
MTEMERDRIENCCRRLVTAYARATDLGDGETAAALFTPDGQLDMPGGRSFHGREQIARRIREQPPRQVSRHVIANASIEPQADDRATGLLYVTMYRGERPGGGGPVPLQGPYLVGEYEDEYRLTPEGWRIARRRLTTVFRREGA